MLTGHMWRRNSVVGCRGLLAHTAAVFCGVRTLCVEWRGGIDTSRGSARGSRERGRPMRGVRRRRRRLVVGRVELRRDQTGV